MPDDTIIVNTKDKGQGIMLNSYVSCDFILAFNLNENQMKSVNKNRKINYILTKKLR